MSCSLEFPKNGEVSSVLGLSTISMHIIVTLKIVVGFDIVELCPNEVDKSSDFLAAKLYYKMLSYKFQHETIEDDYDNAYDEKPLNNISKFKEEDDY